MRLIQCTFEQKFALFFASLESNSISVQQTRKKERKSIESNSEFEIKANFFAAKSAFAASTNAESVAQLGS